jgi:hypothetical protein
MRRVLRNLISSVRERDPGVTLVQIDKWTLAEELWSFGEDSLYREPLRMDDERDDPSLGTGRKAVLARKSPILRRSRCFGGDRGNRRSTATASAYATPTTSRPSQLPPNARRAVCGDQPGRGERELPADVAMTPLGDNPERWPLADGPRSPGRKGRGNPCAVCTLNVRSKRTRANTHETESADLQR